MALAYAVAHDLDLDDSVNYHDLGVSAFRGANLESGQLGAFREAVRAGLVPRGSILLMEALDRLTRMDPWDAVSILRDIMREGIKIVTVGDGRVYDEASVRGDPLSLLTAVVIFMRGNEESETKARRLKAAWSSKRATALSKPLTSTTPAWIKLERRSDGDRLVLIPERADIVKRMVDEAMSGLSRQRIADRLNDEQAPCFGNAKWWHRTYINKILSNPALAGVIIPHQYRMDGNKRVRVPLEPIPGYYPSVISEDNYSALQSLFSTVSVARPRDSKSGLLHNILAGLACCPHCGDTMTRVSKGPSSKAGRPRLICVRAKTGNGCIYKAVDLSRVEAGLLENIDGIFIGCPSAVEGLDIELERAEAGIAALNDQIENVLDAVSKSSMSAALAGRLASLEETLRQEETSRQEVIARIASGSSLVLTHRLKALEASLRAVPLDRAEVNALLRVLLQSVEIDYPFGQLHLRWTHGGESSVSYAWPLQQPPALVTP